MMTTIGGTRELVEVDRPTAPFKRLLVPLDGSPLSERALPFARALARIVEGDLILVRTALAARGYPDPGEAEVMALMEAERYLKGLAARYGASYPVEYSVPYGEPGREIPVVARTRRADLIVMTTHGRTGLSRLLLGSVADEMVRRTQIPLLLVRAGLPIDTWEQGLGRILVPLDGSALAEEVLPTVASLAATTNARLTLLQVIGPAMPELSAYEIARLPEDDEALATEAAAYLNRVAGRLREQGLHVETEVAFGDPAECIASTTAQFRFDLVAMATHGRAGIDRLVVGSVADRVLHHAEVPLLVMRGA